MTAEVIKINIKNPNYSKQYIPKKEKTIRNHNILEMFPEFKWA